MGLGQRRCLHTADRFADSTTRHQRAGRPGRASGHAVQWNGGAMRLSAKMKMRHWLVSLAVVTLPWLWSAPARSQDAGVLYGVKVAGGRAIVRVLDLSSARDAQDKGTLSQPADQRLLSIFQNADCGVGIVGMATGSGAQHRSKIRMIGTPEHVMDAGSRSVGALKPGQVVSSMLVLQTGQALAIIGTQAGTPPFALAMIA